MRRARAGNHAPAAEARRPRATFSGSTSATVAVQGGLGHLPTPRVRPASCLKLPVAAFDYLCGSSNALTAMYEYPDELLHAPLVAPAGRHSHAHGLLDTIFARVRAGYLLSSDAMPAPPPPQLSERIAAAARAWDSLAASGRHVTFDAGENGRVRIELRDERGTRLAALGPSQLFDLIETEARG